MVTEVRPSMRYVRKAGGWLLTLLLAALAAVTVATATGFFAITPVLSGSMRPAFNPGDAMLTKRVSVHSLHVGDIVNIKLPPQDGGRQRVHRIVAIRHQGTAVAVRTKGDANNLIDPGWFVLKGNQYRTVARLRWVGWLADFRAANGGLLCLAALTVVGAISLVQRLRRGRGPVVAAITAPTSSR
jgi:signal peptidase